MDKLAAPELGYRFHPKRYAHSPGHPRLDVILPATPSEEHYDPERLRVRVASIHGGVEYIVLHHPWHSAITRYRACAGRVILWDRRGKEVVTFTFGGDLSIEPGEAHTTCTLASPAPIILLTDEPTIPRTLAEEVEVLLARRRAAWGLDKKEYEQRLASADPLALYAACLEVLSETPRTFREGPGDERARQFRRFVQAEIEALREADLWPPTVPALDELL
jgi:hypothetical protein